MSTISLASNTLAGTPAAGAIEYNGQFYGTDSNAARAQLQRLAFATSVASTSGVAIDFTSIPAWAKRITIIFQGVSTSGTSFPMVQIGAGSFVATGYASAGGNAPNGSSTGVNNNTSGFILEGGTAMSAAGTLRHGRATLYNITGNAWVFDSLTANSATTNIGFGAGSISLSGTLDRVRITTVNGTDTFDAGNINIMYEG